MESLHKPAKTQLTFTSQDPATPATNMPEHEAPNQGEESFEATILRLDQHTAERLFRKAGIPDV